MIKHLLLISCTGGSLRSELQQQHILWKNDGDEVAGGAEESATRLVDSSVMVMDSE